MPNLHTAICPFYVGEKHKSISCEDTYRRFCNSERRDAWLHMYCETWDWMRCPYASDLSEAYERYEKGDKEALEKNAVDSLRKELKSVTTKLGRAEKRTERQQKKIDELRAVNQSLVTMNEGLNYKNRHLLKKWKDANKHNKEFEEKVWDQVQKISRMYEQRICYLIEEFVPDKKFTESDVASWAEDKAFALVYDVDEDEEHEPYWVVRYGEEKTDGQQDKDVQTDVQEGKEVRKSEGRD